MRLSSKSALVLGVLIIAATIASFGYQTQTMASPRSIIYDSRFAAAMGDLSRSVPEGAVLVTSTNGPFVTYFTGHTATVPWGVTSKQELIVYMNAKGYMFLVAFEDKSDLPELKGLFSSKGLKSLGPEFVQLGEYQTDFYHIILYQLKL